MEVVLPWEEVEADIEDKEVALRGRLPRQNSNTTTTTATITTTITASKVGEDSTDKSLESSSDEEANGTPRNGVSNAENRDTKSTNGHSGFDDRQADFLVSEENPADQTLELKTGGLKVEKIDAVNYQYEIKVENIALSAAFSASPSSQKKNGKRVSLSNETTTTTTIEHGEANTRSRSEQEEEERGEELDLQRLYQRQGQHEFVCPNCRACITKVIIRELEIRPPSSPPPRRIRCTSCFSFLSLAGKIFWPDSDEEDATVADDIDRTKPTQPLEHVSEIQSDQNTEAAPTTKIREHKIGEIRPNKPSSDNSKEVTGLQEQVPSRGLTLLLEEQIGAQVIATEPSLNDSGSITEVQEKVPPKDSHGTLHDKKHPLRELVEAIFSAKRFRSNLDKNGTLKVPLLETKGPEVHEPLTQLPGRSPEVTVTETTKPQASGLNVAVSGGPQTPQEELTFDEIRSAVEVEEENEGRSEMRINIATRDPKLVTTQGSSKSWEILKSIVYGGSAESIASLGIVTSAASGNASTLNIVSLALANLLGGLFIIIHNIWELKDDQSKVHCSRTNEQVDRYQEVLGRRENFILHAFVAILSFLVFGLVPPVVYGFSFRQTDDKDLKLAAVAAASLICIALLAVAKAQIQNPHKYLKTVTYYIVIGLGVSGVSYVAGKLINQLIEKFESYESPPAFTPPLPGMRTAKHSWGSY